jgi:predicted Co/Zn/Cd cation transporter (cation efflux family)
LPAANQQSLIGRTFFPNLISAPFHQGLMVVFAVAAVLSLLAAVASLLRGGRYVATDVATDGAADLAADVAADEPV